MLQICQLYALPFFDQKYVHGHPSIYEPSLLKESLDREEDEADKISSIGTSYARQKSRYPSSTAKEVAHEESRCDIDASCSLEYDDEKCNIIRLVSRCLRRRLGQKYRSRPRVSELIASVGSFRLFGVQYVLMLISFLIVRFEEGVNLLKSVCRPLS
jgi:hypothetical protein